MNTTLLFPWSQVSSSSPGLKEQHGNVNVMPQDQQQTVVMDIKQEDNINKQVQVQQKVILLKSFRVKTWTDPVICSA